MLIAFRHHYNNGALPVIVASPDTAFPTVNEHFATLIRADLPARRPKYCRQAFLR